MNPIIQQITLDEEIENFADKVADDIYAEFDKFHKPEIKMTKYQAAMSFCIMLKKSLYMRIVNSITIPGSGLTFDEINDIEDEVQE